MKHRKATHVLLTALWVMACGPPNASRYPSYEKVMAKYAPKEESVGVKLKDPNAFPPSRYCDCPRVWYHDHWVYYYRGRWIYWDLGFWHYYPHFHVYYHGGHPHVYERRGRAVTTNPPPQVKTRRIKSSRPEEKKPKTRKIGKPPRPLGTKVRPHHVQPPAKKR